jgi:hypothetical protein
LFVFFCVSFQHEAGHAIAGLLLGQSPTEFDVNFWNLGAHVEMTGGESTPLQLAIRVFIWNPADAKSGNRTLKMPALKPEPTQASKMAVHCRLSTDQCSK